jgi:aryl-alcohol dehydrogenase-like predicted oxidoreductase
MYISALAYGNWTTHGEQIDQDAATACVRKALDLGITTFDTADAYANTRAETALRELHGRIKAAVDGAVRGSPHGLAGV